MARTPARQDAANPVQIQALSRQEKRRVKRYLEALRQVLELPAGRLVIGELRRGILAKGGIYQKSFTGDPHVDAYQQGRRELALEFLEQCYAASTQNTLLMESESRAREMSDHAERAAQIRETAVTTDNPGEGTDNDDTEH